MTSYNMQAGKLRRRISVDEPIATQNETGEEEIAFTEVATVWGSIEPGKGRESLVADQILPRLTTAVVIRWTPDVDQITPAWRLRHRGISYNIIDVVQVDLRHREIQLTCESGANAG